MKVMPTFVNVLCRSFQAISFEKVRDFIRDGVFFESTPRLESFLKDAQPSSDGWTHIEIYYHEGKRPVVISRLLQREKVEEQREEAIEELLEHALPGDFPYLLQNLQEFHHAFVFEIDPVGATEDCWMMVDALTAWLAASHDGIVFVSGEGFYDASLQLICGLSS